MHKNFLYGLVSIMVIVLGTFAFQNTYKASDKDQRLNKVQSNAKDSEISQNQKPIFELSNNQREAAKKEVGTVNSEQDFLKKALGLSFQKIKIDGEQDQYKIPGIVESSVDRIQITKTNLIYLKEKLDSLKITNDEKSGEYTYKKILTRWINGDFNSIIQDFKTLRNDFNKPKGYSETGSDHEIKIIKRSKTDEQEYIKHFFGN
ncbi:hypothetical protein ACF5W4_01320 [Bacillota bacterium Lsc_1132]